MVCLLSACEYGALWAGTLRSETMPVDCDLLIVAHNHDFVSQTMRNRLRLGAIGYHPSLLPLPLLSKVYPSL